ncbi:MAG: hypothetical protein MAG453_00762 [Calditrichaeota bacterium]|nr:hypothetical protein [Calditrichota bacterium]
MRNAPPPRRPPLPHLVSVAVVSAIVLALQIVLTRLLSIASWHHFAYFVISTALLGFGVSGTVLALWSDALARRFARSAAVFSLLLAATIPLSLLAAQRLPIDVRYLLFSWEQAGYLLIYHALLLVPFLAGALVIGLALVRYGGSAPRVYGVNLFGSGFGAGAVVLFLDGIAPHVLLGALSALALLAAPLWMVPRTGQPARRGSWRPWLVLALGAAVTVAAVSALRAPPADPYKMEATLARWAAQGDARRVEARHTARAKLDLVASGRLHQTLFAGLSATAAPPAQFALLADGHLADPVFRIDRAGDARILSFTPQSLPHRLLDSADVLLLDEQGGTNVWLARMYGARRITVVQANGSLIDLVRALPDSSGGGVYRGRDLRVVTADPRQFLETNRDRFDIIRVSSVEGMAAGVSGTLTMHETHLLTVEALARCFDRLTPRGMIVLVRGLQTPPRDNPKLLLTSARALEEAGIRSPAEHLLQAHNYLAAVTLVFRTPLDSIAAAGLADQLAALDLTLDHAPGDAIGRGEREIDRSAPDDSLSLAWFAARLLGPGRGTFLDRYGYDLRPATDSRPYFFHFFRWRSLPLFFDTYGPHWLQRLELGYVVAVIVLVETALAGAALILLPIARMPGIRGRRGPWGVIVYFAALGFGYLFLEMVTLQRLSLLFGDPVYATAFTLAVFLVLSGAGSLTARSGAGTGDASADTAGGSRWLRDAGRVAAAAVAAFVALRVANPWLVALPFGWKLAAALVLIGPAAFLMGRPFPRGIVRLERASPAQLPLAWAVNGFASVAAAPLAILLAVSWGYLPVVFAAAGLYLIAMRAWGRLG